MLFNASMRPILGYLPAFHDVTDTITLGGDSG